MFFPKPVQINQFFELKLTCPHRQGNTSLSNIIGTSIRIISSKTRTRLFYHNEMQPLNIKLILHQVVFMPQEHTSAITQKGTLKSEVRTKPMIYHSNIWSSLVLIEYQFSIPLSYYFLLSRTFFCCHLEALLKTEHKYSSFWIYSTDT